MRELGSEGGNTELIELTRGEHDTAWLDSCSSSFICVDLDVWISRGTLRLVYACLIDGWEVFVVDRSGGRVEGARPLAVSAVEVAVVPRWRGGQPWRIVWL